MSAKAWFHLPHFMSVNFYLFDLLRHYRSWYYLNMDSWYIYISKLWNSISSSRLQQRIRACIWSSSNQTTIILMNINPIRILLYKILKQRNLRFHYIEFEVPFWQIVFFFSLNHNSYVALINNLQLSTLQIL